MAITFWEVLTGVLPFSEHRNLNINSQLPFMVLRGVRPSLSALPADVPAPVLEVIKCGWDRDARLRGTAQHAVDALAAIMAVY